MNIERLSKRLETVVSFIHQDARIADIGSDHAYLPCYAVNKGIASSAIAGEVVEGPYQSALKQVQKAELTEKIAVRKGDGLAVIEKGEVDTIIIAGMGGSLITQILDQGKEKLESVSQLILQPNLAAHLIREWLIEHGFELKAEKIIEEDQKIYEILVAEKGNVEAPYSQLKKEILVGPFLLKEKNHVFIKKWSNEYKKLQYILSSIENAEADDKSEERKSTFIEQMKLIEEVLS